MRRVGLRAAGCAIVAVLAACTPHTVGPARTFSKYEGKAVTTAESALSAVETVRLAADTADKDNAFGPYLSELISNQEDALSGVQGTFASIQPPDEESDTLRAELDDLLTNALDHVTDVRIAVRRGELHQLGQVAESLTEDAAALEQFVKDHGS